MNINLQPKPEIWPSIILDDLKKAIQVVWDQSPASKLPPLDVAEPSLSIELVSLDEIRAINADYRQIDRATDVLSFPMLPMVNGDLSEPLAPGDVHDTADGHMVVELGDIVISPEIALQQSIEYGHSLKRELIFLAVHGMCHLCGYDHETDVDRTVMEQQQESILNDLGILRSPTDDTQQALDRALVAAMLDQLRLLDTAGEAAETNLNIFGAWMDDRLDEQTETSVLNSSVETEAIKSQDCASKKLSVSKNTHDQAGGLSEAKSGCDLVDQFTFSADLKSPLKTEQLDQLEANIWHSDVIDGVEVDGMNSETQGDDAQYTALDLSAINNRTPEGFRSGFIALVGRPNAGKSTLLNYMSGAHLAIVSRKAQTTRHTIRSVVTDDDAQYIFVDTPGMHIPGHKMGKQMMKDAWASFKDADIVLLLVDGHKGNITTIEDSILKKATDQQVPVIVALNKVDDMSKENLLPIMARYHDYYDFAAIVPISAKTGDGVDILKEEIYRLLPEGPQYFSPDCYTDQSEKTLVAELIREQILHYTHDEIPHGTAVKIDQFDEGDVQTADDLEARRIVRIDATIYCNKKTHKSILIGKKGQTLKRIASSSRRQIEAMLGCKVYMQLFVKVRTDWLNEPSILADLSYDPIK